MQALELLQLKCKCNVHVYMHVRSHGVSRARVRSDQLEVLVMYHGLQSVDDQKLVIWYDRLSPVVCQGIMSSGWSSNIILPIRAIDDHRIHSKYCSTCLALISACEQERENEVVVGQETIRMRSSYTSPSLHKLKRSCIRCSHTSYSRFICLYPISISMDMAPRPADVQSLRRRFELTTKTHTGPTVCTDSTVP